VAWPVDVIDVDADADSDSLLQFTRASDYLMDSSIIAIAVFVKYHLLCPPLRPNFISSRLPALQMVRQPIYDYYYRLVIRIPAP
jgi:hypothetical protein